MEQYDRGSSRLVNWELFQLMNNSQLTMNGNLTLGDSGTGSGTLTIDSSSTLFVGQQQRVITPFTAGQPVFVINAGTIDLTNGGSSTADILRINGNYIGQNGRQLLNTVLGTDGSPSDKLVVSGGQMSGNTTIGIVNVNGPGARTTGNGILVVEAVNGATSTASAFALSSRVAAGAFDYQLFRGGFTAGSGSNWYLRNTITPQPPVPPDPGPPAPPSPPGPVDPDAGTNGNTQEAGTGTEPKAIPLYRPEVALHAVLPNVARSAVRTMLGTFHDREGEQAYASGDGAFQAGWARVFGGSYQQGWSGDVNPTFKGNIWGLQVGFPVFGLEHSGGEKDRAGVFFGYSSVSGAVTGFADGQQGAPVGNVGLSVYSAGIYWTHFWPKGGYLDAVVMESWMTDTTQSTLNVSTTNNGRMFSSSLELGYPIPLSSSWAIEPQAQFIFHHFGDDLLNDTFAQVSAAQDNAFTGRIGARLVGNLVTDKAIIKPFALVNLWHGFDDQDTIAFNMTSIATNQSVTSMEFGGGVSASLSTWADVYAKVSYTTDIDGNTQNSVSGRLGFRLVW